MGWLLTFGSFLPSHGQGSVKWAGCWGLSPVSCSYLIHGYLTMSACFCRIYRISWKNYSANPNKFRPRKPKSQLRSSPCSSAAPKSCSRVLRHRHPSIRFFHFTLIHWLKIKSILVILLIARRGSAWEQVMISGAMAGGRLVNFWFWYQSLRLQPPPPWSSSSWAPRRLSPYIRRF